MNPTDTTDQQPEAAPPLFAMPRATVSAVPCEFLIGLNSDVVSTAGFAAPGLKLLTFLKANGVKAITTLRETPGAVAVEPGGAAEQPKLIGNGAPVEYPFAAALAEDLLMLHVTLPPGTSAQAFVDAVRRLPGVWFADPVRAVFANAPVQVPPIVLPKAPPRKNRKGIDIQELWHKHQIRYSDTISMGDEDYEMAQFNNMPVSCIAVLDDGCDDVEGVTFVETTASSSASHGTQVVATVHDMLPNARVTVMKITEATADTIDKDRNLEVTAELTPAPGVKLTRYLLVLCDVRTLPGIRVVNISRGQPDWTMAEWDAIDNLEKAGILVVAASGNSFDSNMAVDFPAGFPCVLSVGAVTVDPNGDAKVWECSCYALEIDAIKCLRRKTTGVDIVAPGGGIFIGDDELWGTSFAAPIVSALAGLLFTLRPKLTPAEVRTILCGAVEDPELDAGEDRDRYGRGIVNWQGAVAEALKRPE